jgi:two-component system response regulator DesR
MRAEALRVLCVDDNPGVRQALRLTLSRDGIDCIGCLSGAEDLPERAERDRPAVVVMDMAGPETFGAIRRLGECCPGTRVVVFTGYVRDELIDRAFDAGAWGYVAKDGPVGNLVRAVREVAAGRVALDLGAERVCPLGNSVGERRAPQ